MASINETREPTLTEIRDEIIKQAERSRISMWLTPAAFGGSIALFGVGQIIRLTTGVSDLYTTAIPIILLGLYVMFWTQTMARKAQERFKSKWGSLPRD